ncbi:FKBP-type peptidyl-prolyl cis-trans isomerase [Wielerella bovis]|nr:FKBP-type peptidyl-prolyl cis-trans isomerase [Wielerella bovis]ULJ61485.1 FKBP-type peptidyl-prolyl cis-trans isomerase [Wielerella bovis]
MVDQTHEQPFTVELSRHSLIAGLVEGLQLMQKGGEYTLFIPTNLVYGENLLYREIASASSNIPLNAMLIFEMKVADVQAAPSNKKTSPRTKRR